MGYLLGAVTQDKLDKQRGVVQNEKRQGDNQPYGLVEYMTGDNLLPVGHPYRHSVIGSMADLDAASLEDVKGWFRQHYGPNNAVLVLAGDIDVPTAKVLVEKHFGSFVAGPKQGPVTVTTSTDDTFADLARHEHPFARIVFPDDLERFIHVPTSPEKDALESSAAVRSTLADVGLKVSTGPVVDFRLKEHLRAMPERGTVPLLYPGHFNGSGAMWPIEGAKKPNAIVRDDESEKWLYPNGFYCVVRRFSSKEEKRRVVASVVEPGAVGNAPMLGFENHPLPPADARRLRRWANVLRFAYGNEANAKDPQLSVLTRERFLALYGMGGSRSREA